MVLCASLVPRRFGLWSSPEIATVCLTVPHFVVCKGNQGKTTIRGMCAFFWSWYPCFCLPKKMFAFFRAAPHKPQRLIETASGRATDLLRQAHGPSMLGSLVSTGQYLGMCQNRGGPKWWKGFPQKSKHTFDYCHLLTFWGTGGPHFLVRRTPVSKTATLCCKTIRSCKQRE